MNLIQFLANAYRWYGEFNRGRSSLQDEFRECRPKSVVVPETIDAVHQLLLQDRHVTYHEIETTLGISGTSILSILHEHLTAKKICSRWIRHNLSIAQKKAGGDWSKEVLQKYDRGDSKHVYDILTGDESWISAYDPISKQQSIVWVFQDKLNPTKVARAGSTFKQLITCFWGKTGHVAIVPLEQRTTVNSEWYTTIFFSSCLPRNRKTKRRRLITPYHDNASSHNCIFEHPKHRFNESPAV